MGDFPREYLTEDQIEFEKEAEHLKALFSVKVGELINDPNFEDFVCFLLDITNFNGNNYTTDERTNVYLQGRRAVFMDILSALEEADPTYYPRILLKRARGPQKDG